MTNPGGMFSAVEPLAKTRDVSVRPHHSKHRVLPTLEKQKKQVSTHFANLTSGAIYRRGHPALHKAPKPPNEKHAATALLARAIKAGV